MTDNMTNQAKGLKFVLRALRYRNYRLFFSGQAISLIGTWMQSIATSWLVYQLTKSELLLGVFAFAGQVPAFFAAPFGGIVADRFRRHRALVITQVLSMLQAFALAFLYMTNRINVEWIIALTVFMGLINAFDIPIRQSFVLELIEDRQDLVNAIALNSSIFNGARLIGPSIAGIVIAAFGEGTCFLINGVSYIAVIAALLAMKIPYEEIKKHNGHVLTGLKEGFNYTFGFPPLRSILLLLCLIGLVPFQVLMPVFANKILHGESHTYGFLIGFLGLGAFLGAIYLASRRNVKGMGKVIVLGGILFGIGIIAVSLTWILWLALLLMIIAGFGMMVSMAASNTMLQTIADDDKRGRVMSFYTMSFMGTAPLGSLLGGWMAQGIGVPNTYLLSGICCMLGSLWFASKLPHLPQINRGTRESTGPQDN